MSDWAEANAGRLCYEMGKRAPCVGRLAASSYRAHPSYVLAHSLPYVPVDDQRVEGSVAHRSVLLSHKGCNLLDGLLRQRLTPPDHMPKFLAFLTESETRVL